MRTDVRETNTLGRSRRALISTLEEANADRIVLRQSRRSIVARSEGTAGATQPLPASA